MKKEYGSYKTDTCVFCGRASIKKNKLQLPVCKEHQDHDDAPAFRCVCGDYVDILTGKYGVYAKCYRCGNMNFSKILEHNRMIATADKGSDRNLGGNKLDGYYKVQHKRFHKKEPEVSKEPKTRGQKDEYTYGIFLD